MSGQDSTGGMPQTKHAGVDAWLREHLGRQLTVAILDPEGATRHAEQASELVRALARYAEIRVVPPALAGEEVPLAEHLDRLGTLDPEIVLVVDPADEEATAAADDDEPARRLRALLDELEQRGILNRAFVALVGAGTTRERARRLGFEDGFPFQSPSAQLAGILAREGVAVDERRRGGSSPPCYL